MGAGAARSVLFNRRFFLQPQQKRGCKGRSPLPGGLEGVPPALFSFFARFAEGETRKKSTKTPFPEKDHLRDIGKNTPPMHISLHTKAPSSHRHATRPD